MEPKSDGSQPGAVAASSPAGAPAASGTPSPAGSAHQTPSGGAKPAAAPNSPGVSGGPKPEPLHHDLEFANAIKRKNEIAEQVQTGEKKVSSLAQQAAFLQKQIEERQRQLSGQPTLDVSQLDEGFQRPIQEVHRQTQDLTATVHSLNQKVFGMEKAIELDSVTERLKSMGFKDDVDEHLQDMNKLFAQYPKMPLWEIYWAVKGPKSASEARSAGAQEILQNIQASAAAGSEAPSVATTTVEVADGDTEGMIRKRFRELQAAGK